MVPKGPECVEILAIATYARVERHAILRYICNRIERWLRAMEIVEPQDGSPERMG